MSSNRITVIELLFGGVGVALLSFLAAQAWSIYTKKNISSDSVDVALRANGSAVVIYIRNNSDENLDIVKTELLIRDDEIETEMLGVFPEVSKTYIIDSLPNAVINTNTSNSLEVFAETGQAISPGGVDQFEIMLRGPLGFIDLSDSSLKVKLHDIKNVVIEKEYQNDK